MKINTLSLSVQNGLLKTIENNIIKTNVIKESNIKENNIIENDIPLPKLSLEFKKPKKVTLPEVLVPKKYHPVVIAFKVEPEHVAKLEFNDPTDQRKRKTTVYHIFPRLDEYQGGLVPEDINPRAHFLESLKGSRIAKDIENTLKEKPESFYILNRGIVILAESFHYDPNTQLATIKITNSELFGCLDGGTTDRIIAKVQRSLLGNKNINEIPKDQIPEILKIARVHIELIESFTEKDKIVELSDSRNSAVKVKSYSLDDLRGSFDWIKDVIEKENGLFKNKIGYDENSLQDVSILEVIALATLFHKESDVPDDEGKLGAPIVAYSSKGKLSERLTDETLLPGYKALAPILEDILKLHDYIYSTFDEKYNELSSTSSRLGRRTGFDSLTVPYELPLTGAKTNYMISNGILYPLLNSFRALVSYDRETGLAKWKKSPFNFWNEHGSKLVRLIIEHLSALKTPTQLGKDRLAYINLYKEAKLLLLEA